MNTYVIIGNRKIKRIAIYYSRYGVIHSCPVESRDNNVLAEFASLLGNGEVPHE